MFKYLYTTPHNFTEVEHTGLNKGIPVHIIRMTSVRPPLGKGWPTNRPVVILWSIHSQCAYDRIQFPVNACIHIEFVGVNAWHTDVSHAAVSIFEIVYLKLEPHVLSSLSAYPNEYSLRSLRKFVGKFRYFKKGVDHIAGSVTSWGAWQGKRRLAPWFGSESLARDRLSIGSGRARVLHL